MSDCRLGAALHYDTAAMVEVPFKAIEAVNRYANEHSFMFVGQALRRYTLGCPMGDPLSAAKSQGLCLVGEHKFQQQREHQHQDSIRNNSFCFMDDLFLRVAYCDSAGWSKDSAASMLEQLKAVYKTPLELE